MEEGSCDNPWMGEHTGAAALFGTTGGVTEAVLRSLYYFIHGRELDELEILQVRGTRRVKEAEVDLGPGIGTVKIAIGHGLKAARELVEEVKAGTSPYGFIEFMGCPGGCMAGGGQPREKKSYQSRSAVRQQALYAVDRSLPVRRAHLNPLIQKLYADFLEKPLSHRSHELLHTTYRDRRRQVSHTIREIWQEIRRT
jgi:ferredoxin hydrogenase gamma subunit